MHTSVRPVPDPTDVAAVLAHHMSALQDLLGVCSVQQALLERQGELLAEQSQLVEDARRELAALRAGTAPGVGSGLAPSTGGRDDASTAGD